MNARDIRSVHLVGIGGINMSAVAKILLSHGVKVTGSDVNRNEQVELLAERGVDVKIGHAAENVPSDVDLLVYSSAVPSSNPERQEAAKRGIKEQTNFQFLGEWYDTSKTVLVTGTHGKSTTTAMLGLVLELAGMDPTVILGSKIATFPDGNLRLGKSGWCVIEGDEYAKHFLEFRPYAVLLNNIELDHTDIFPTLEDMVAAFHELLMKVRDGGVVVANAGDQRVKLLIGEMETVLTARRVKILKFNDSGSDVWRFDRSTEEGTNGFSLAKDSMTYRFVLAVPGAINCLNAAGAAVMSLGLGVQYHQIAEALASFQGIWRRFESLGQVDGVQVYSDYGHHPTAVEATLKLVHEAHPTSKLILCFQPHHRNRTRILFDDFVASFDRADVLVLCEIYDVAGRDASEDADMSSRKLVDAVKARDRENGTMRAVEYAADPKSSVQRAFELAEPSDVIIFMGAGDIDEAVRSVIDSGFPPSRE